MGWGTCGQHVEFFPWAPAPSSLYRCCRPELGSRLSRTPGPQKPNPFEALQGCTADWTTPTCSSSRNPKLPSPPTELRSAWVRPCHHTQWSSRALSESHERVLWPADPSDQAISHGQRVGKRGHLTPRPRHVLVQLVVETHDLFHVREVVIHPDASRKQLPQGTLTLKLCSQVSVS